MLLAQQRGEKLAHTFARFALPIVWDYCEVNPLAATSGSFAAMSGSGGPLIWTAPAARSGMPPHPRSAPESAIALSSGGFDVIATDPPYYDAIPYSDLMDFFHIWLRRVLRGLSAETDAAFADPLGPKWDRERGDGELVDDAARFGGDREASKQNYEDGMARAFTRFREALADDGRLVIVFANKGARRLGDPGLGAPPLRLRGGRLLADPHRDDDPPAFPRLGGRSPPRSGWSAGSAPPRPPAGTRRCSPTWSRTSRSASATSGTRASGDPTWCGPRPAPGSKRSAAIRRCAASGPRARPLSVSEFLRRVRRMVVGSWCGGVLQVDGDERGDLDGLTTYYLLHRKDFRLEPAPAGAAILYALSCGLRDGDLAGRSDLLVRGGAAGGGDDEAPTTASGGEARLKAWNQRRSRTLGEPAADGAAPPLIDCLHRLMRLWKDGDRQRVDAYLEARGLWNNSLFDQVAQAVLELSDLGGVERSILESIQKHLKDHGGAAAPRYLGSI